MRERLISRREALTLGLAAAGVLVRPRSAEVAAAVRQSGAPPGAGGSGLIVRNARPLDAESPLEALRTFETRNELFFVRGHHAPPADVSTPWTLTIDGDVARPLTFQLEDIRRMRAERRQRDDRVRRQRPRPFRAAGDFRRAVGARRREYRDVDRRPACRVARTRRRSAVRAALLDGGRRSQPAPGGTEVPPQYSSRSGARTTHWWPTR